MDNLLSFLNELLGLVPAVGFAVPLIAFVVDQLKRFNVLPDGYAPLASLVLNLVMYTVVYFAGDPGKIETVTVAIEQLAPFIVALIVSLVNTPKVHDALAGAGIGYKHK